MHGKLLNNNFISVGQLLLLNSAENQQVKK